MSFSKLIMSLYLSSHSYYHSWLESLSPAKTFPNAFETVIWPACLLCPSRPTSHPLKNLPFFSLPNKRNTAPYITGLLYIRYALAKIQNRLQCLQGVSTSLLLLFLIPPPAQAFCSPTQFPSPPWPPGGLQVPVLFHFSNLRALHLLWLV